MMQICRNHSCAICKSDLSYSIRRVKSFDMYPFHVNYLSRPRKAAGLTRVITSYPVTGLPRPRDPELTLNGLALRCLYASTRVSPSRSVWEDVVMSRIQSAGFVSGGSSNPASSQCADGKRKAVNDGPHVSAYILM